MLNDRSHSRRVVLWVKVLLSELEIFSISSCVGLSFGGETPKKTLADFHIELALPL